MLAKKMTEDEIIVCFHRMHEEPAFAPQIRDSLVKKLSYIPCSLVGKYRKYDNYEDLKQVAYMTFIHAINTFDYRRGDNFKGWCWWWIRKEVAKEAYAQKVYLQRRVRLSTKRWEEEELVDSYEDILVAFDSTYHLHKAIHRLDGRSSYIIQASFGISCEALPLREIGSHLGVSHESVRRYREIAMQKLLCIMKDCEHSND